MKSKITIQSRNTRERAAGRPAKLHPGIAALILATVLVLSGCFLELRGEEGALSINVTGDFSPAGAKGFGDGTNDYVRVYLIGNGRLTPIAGKDYAAASASSGSSSITVDGIPAGPTYRAMLAFGDADSADDPAFLTSHYAESEEFEIVPGGTVKLDVTQQALPSFITISQTMAGKNVKGVAVYELNGVMYAADSNYLYNNSVSDFGNKVSVSSYNLNSISEVENIDGIYINSQNGIQLYNGSNFSQVYSGNAVLESGTNGDYRYFQGDGIIGGSENSGTSWTVADLSDGISGAPVYDFFIDGEGNTDDGYFASKLGAFYIQNDSISSIEGDFFGTAKFFDIIEDGEAVRINTLDSDGTNFYLGTENGVYQSSGPITEGDNTNITLISETEGYPIRKVELNGNDGVFISDYSFFVKDVDSITRYPFTAGMPGTPTGYSWSGTTLFISGASGVISLSF